MSRLRIAVALALFFGLIFPLSPDLLAKPGSGPISGVGTIDLARVLVLHPAMASYDPVLKGFLLPKVTVPPTAAKLDKATEKEIVNLEKKIQANEVAMEAIRKSHGEVLQAIMAQRDGDGDKKPAPEDAEVRKAQARIETGREDLAFFVRIHALQIQNKQYQEKIDSLRYVSSPLVTPVEETQKRFFRLLEEIRQVTREVADANGIQVVLDSSASTLRESVPNPGTEQLFSGAKYLDVFQSQPPSEVQNDTGAIEGFVDLQKTKVDNWIDQRNSILSPFKKSLGATYVVTGGRDLTVDVLKSLFSKYNVPKPVQEVVLKTLEPK